MVRLYSPLTYWQTPHSLSFNLQMASALPPDLIESSFETIYHSLAPATKSTYSAGLFCFTQFCDKYEIPKSDHMPTSFLILVVFISEHIGSVSGKTIRGWLSGLKAWHDTYHTEWCSDDRWLQMAWVMANKEGTAFHLKQHHPVTLDHLLTLYEGLDLMSPTHTACWAITACSVWGVCQFVFPPSHVPLLPDLPLSLGKLTVSSIQAIDPKLHVTCSTIIISYTNCDMSTGTSFHVPWTKTMREDGATITLTACDNHIFLIKALTFHFLMNSQIPDNAPLFAFTSTSRYSLPTKSFFLSMVFLNLGCSRPSTSSRSQLLHWRCKQAPNCRCFPRGGCLSRRMDFPGLPPVLEKG